MFSPCSVFCLMLRYICVKFSENTTNGIRVIRVTLMHGTNGYVQCLKGNNSKRRLTRVTVHMFCTSSRVALH